MVELGILETKLISWEHLRDVNIFLSQSPVRHEIPKHDSPSYFNKPILLLRQFLYLEDQVCIEAYSAPSGNGFYIVFTYPRDMEERNTWQMGLAEKLQAYIEGLTGTKMTKTYHTLPEQHSTEK